MRFSILLPALAGVSVAQRFSSADLLSYIRSHPGSKGASSAASDFVSWNERNTLALNFTAPAIPKAYLVQLKPGTGLDKREDEDVHAQFHKRAAEAVNYSVRYEFKDAGVFFGLSIQVKDDANETTIARIPNVLKVWPVRLVPRPGLRGDVSPKASIARVNAVDPLNITATAGSRANINALHRATGVERLHAEGVKGKGIKIAVVDTGVDYFHPALGKGYGPGRKISFGKDFIGDKYDETGVPTTDDDPLAQCAGGGHGTHVMGTIGMEDTKDSPFGLIGVAPEATLGMYRVFGCSGSAPFDVILLAFQQAARDKVDIVSMSLGSDMPWESEDPFQIVTKALESLGILVVIANGNSGSLPGQTSSPALGKGAIAVGSTQNSHFPVVYGLKDSRGRSLKYAGDPRPFPTSATGLAVYDILTAAADSNSPEGCTYTAWDAAAAYVKDKENSIIAISHSGGCGWSVKALVAQSYGFKYTIVYTSEDADIYDKEYAVLDPQPGYYATSLNVVDSNTLKGGLAASKVGQYKLFFNSTVFEALTQQTAGLMSSFSSSGPTLDGLSIKPQISAIGGNILSTWPLEAFGYAVLSGTSMATPYVSGAFALLKSKFPNASVQELRERMQGTAKNVAYVYDKSIKAPVPQQGTGLINVYNAIYQESSISPTELNLGDTDALKPREVKVTNNSGRSKTYVITHEPAGEVNVIPYPYDLTEPGLSGAIKSYASVKFSQTSITIAPGQSATFTATFTPPTDIPETYLPVYSGFIKITNNNDEFKVAYLGQPYSRYKAKYLDNTDKAGIGKLPQLIRYDAAYNPIIVTDIAAYDFGTGTPGQGYPYLQWIIQQSAQYLRVEIVPYNTTFKPTYYGFTSTTANPYGVPSSALPLVYPNLKINATVAGAEIFGFFSEINANQRPSGFLYYLDSQILSFGEEFLGELPLGDYRALLRVLKWGGDYTKEADFESWLSPVIRLRRVGDGAKKIAGRKMKRQF